MSDDFERLLERWLRERGRSDPKALSALAGHVAILPPRRSRPRRPLLLAAALVAVVAVVVASLPRFGQTSVGPITSPTGPPTDPSPSTAALATYVGDGFTFEYPVSWRVISGSEHAVLHGPTVAVAVGIGSFDVGCVPVPPPSNAPSDALGGITCGANPIWDVPSDGVVLALHARAYFGGHQPEPTLTPLPGEAMVFVGARPAAATMAPISPVWTWRLDQIPWLIEARFGPDMLKFRQGEVLDLIASWRWTPTEGATPTPAPARTRPPWAADLTGALDCDGPAQDVGGEAGDFGLIWISGSASPGFWLDHLDTVDLPLTGWVEDPEVPETNAGSVRFVNAVEGRIKAVILMVGFSPDGGSGRWAIAGYRACPSSEFDPLRGTTLGDAPWRDASGTVNRRARAVIGPAHCGWESTIFLHLDDRTYIRDPLGLFADRTVGPYVDDAKLPGDAVSTVLTSAGRELFTSPDVNSVWIRVGEVVERWPRAVEQFGCA